VPNFTFIEATCGAKKPIFGPLSKNNTGTAALRTGLPVTICSCDSALVYWGIKHFDPSSFSHGTQEFFVNKL